MDQELYDKLGETRERPDPATADDICKKCGTTLLGKIAGHLLPAKEATKNNERHAFTVTSYCPHCAVKP